MSEPVWNPGAKWHNEKAEDYLEDAERHYGAGDVSEGIHLSNKANHERFSAAESVRRWMPNPKKRHGHSSAYTRFVEKNLPIYIREGMHPTDAMKEVARDWQWWKKDLPDDDIRVSRNPTSSSIGKLLPILIVGGLAWWFLIRKK